MSRKRVPSPEVVDLTIDVTPQRPSRKRKSTYIDLTTPEPTETPLPAAIVEASADSGRIEVVYESRATPVPPARRPLQRRTAHVDLAAADDSDSDLPDVHIPGKRSKPKSPERPILNIPKCSICLETVPELQANNVDLVITSTCSHFFCKPCIEASLKVSKQCPRCRVHIKGKVLYKKMFF